MTCPSEEDLAWFASGSGDATVADHVGRCAVCAEVVEIVRGAGADEPPAQRSHEAVDPTPGETIGRYVVLRQLGRGGMGVVVHAYDPVLDRMVAIKLTRADRATPGL